MSHMLKTAIVAQCLLCVWSVFANSPPEITDISVSHSPSGGDTVHVVCTATDADFDALIYVWTTSDGTLAGVDDLDAQVDWTLPVADGNHTLSVEVTDSHGGVARAERAIPTGPIHEQGAITEAAHQPARIALGTADDLWVTDAARARVLHLSRSGNLLGEFPTAPRPLGVAMQDSNVLLIGEDSLDRVARYSTSGSFIGALGVGSGSVSMPNALAVDPSGKIHAVDSHAGMVRTFGSDGQAGTPYGAGTLDFPVDICISTDGSEVFVADQGLGQIAVFDSNGALLRMIGSPGEFVRLQGVTLDDSGRLFALDAFQDQVRLIESNGDPVVSFGHFGDWSGAFRTPLGLAAVPGDRVFISSSGTSMIEVFAHWIWATIEISGMTLH